MTEVLERDTTPAEIAPGEAQPRSRSTPEPTRPGFWATWREMGRELYDAREVLWQLSWRDLRLRYNQAVMGFMWALLMPMLLVGAGLIMRLAFTTSAGKAITAADIGALTIKAVLWGFVAGAISFAVSSLSAERGLVTRIYFPREVLPWSCVLTQVVDSSLAAVTAVVLLLGLQLLVPAWSWLWVPGLVFLLLMLVAGIALTVGALNLFFRDVKYIVQTLLTFGIFFTPVVFEPIVLGPRGAQLAYLNPLAGLFEGVRLAVIERHNLFYPLVAELNGIQILIWHPGYLAYSAGVAVLTLGLAWWFFHKIEGLFAEYA